MAGSADSPPAFRRPGSLIATSEVLWDVDVSVAPTPPPAEPREHEADGDRHRIMEHRRVVAEPSGDDRVVQHHLAGDIAEYASAEPDNPRVAIHEMSQDACAPDDDRKRKPDPEHVEEANAGGQGGD